MAAVCQFRIGTAGHNAHSLINPAERPFRKPRRLTPSPLSQLLERIQHWRTRLTVPQFTVVTGLLVITVGTVVLAQPVFSSDSVGLWEALFTVISAITVTGLSIVDVGKELTFPGQIVLSLLILTGGLGLILFGAVGLDVGVTAELNRWGQLVLMVGMFVGRIGILLLLSAVFGSHSQPRIAYQHEELYL